MRRTAVAIILALLVGILPATAAADDDIVVTGSGWGHGVGLSQYGAKGMAATGSSAAQILAHYYRGTTLGSISTSTVRPWIATEARPLWVGVMQNETTVTFEPVGGGATLCFEAGGATDCLPNAARAGERWRFRVIDGSTCRFERQAAGTWTAEGSDGPCDGAVTPNGSARISFVFVGRAYRDGILRLRKDPDGSGVHAVWQTAIEPYVRGILEVPSSWPAEALKAQAIAARSYAVARVGWRGSGTALSASRRAACWCNLYNSTYDQQFKGVAAETGPWVAAVDGTAGRIVLAGGRAAETFYSSSSGGRTESNQHYWGSGPISYLQSVDDAAAHTSAAANPHSSWTVRLAPATVASALGFSTVTRVQVLDRYPSGSPSRIEFVGTKGGQAVVTYKTGNQVRSLFGLRSQYLSVDWTGSGAAPTTSTSPPTTAPTSTTSTAPSTTTTVATDGADEATTTAPPASTTTTTTEAPTTTTPPPTTSSGGSDPVVVETPGGGGADGPAPITNRAPEPEGPAQPVAPPPPPAPEAPIESARSIEEIIAADVPVDPASFEFPATDIAPSSPAPAPIETTTPPPPDVEGTPDPLVLAGPVDQASPPSGLRAWAWDAAAEFGSWVARFSRRLVVAAGG